MAKELSLIYLNQVYRIEVTRKKGMRHIISRLDYEKKIIKVSAPYLTTSFEIKKAAGNALPHLLKATITRVKPYEDGYLFYLGKKVYVGDFDNDIIQGYLKKKALPIFEDRVAYFEKLMGIKNPYKVRARAMKSRYGVNSKATHSITLSTTLIHYSLSIIDAVVVHELAHHYQWNHSKEFYAIVLRYCPDYKALHEKLRKGIYE
jgi:predicted metal-dependent hydrolase